MEGTVGTPRLDASDPGDRDAFHRGLDWGDLKGCDFARQENEGRKGDGWAGKQPGKGQRVKKGEEGRAWEEMRLGLCKGSICHNKGLELDPAGCGHKGNQT